MRMIKKGWARILTALLVIVVVVGFTPQMAGPAFAAEGDSAAMSLGTDVLDQNVNTSDAQTVWYADKAWRVIGYDGKDGGAATKSGVATLLAKKILAQTPFYSSDNGSNVYAYSTLKTTVDAIAGSLSDGEKEAVVKKTLTAGPFAGQDTDCVAGNEVKDALMWPLSTKEANAVNTDLRIVDPEDTGFDNSWWLRSPGAEGGYAADVFGDGVVNFSGNPVIEEYASGVRPAFDLNLESVLFTSAAESGKSSGATGGDALSAIADNTTNEWKLTLKDANRNGFKASAAAGATLEVGAGYSDWRVPVVYSGAETGNNEYVSVILCDSNGTAKYYGNIAKNSAASSASGQAVRIPSGLAEGDYTMYVFNEQINEDRMTDYASDFSTIDLTVEKLVPVSIEDAKIVLSWTTVTYNGKVQKPTVKTVGGKALTEGTDYRVKWSNESSKNVGEYTLVIIGKDAYPGVTMTTYKIIKAANPLAVKAATKTATVKYSKLKKKTQTLAVTKVIKFTKKLNDKKTYTLVSAKKGSKSFKKYFKVNNTTGKVTVKKGLKKGTYKVKIKVKAAGNVNYKASPVKTVIFTVKVK